MIHSDSISRLDTAHFQVREANLCFRRDLQQGAMQRPASTIDSSARLWDPCKCATDAEWSLYKDAPNHRRGASEILRKSSSLLRLLQSCTCSRIHTPVIRHAGMGTSFWKLYHAGLEVKVFIHKMCGSRAALGSVWG